MKKENGLKFAILSVSFLLMLRLTISPALAEIGKAFPDVSQGMLMNMVALPSLIAIPFGFLSGILSNYWKKKNILLSGLALFLMGGIGPMFLNAFGPILIMRCILGAGTGLFIPFAAGLIADFYTGDERNAMLGFQSTAVAVGNIITSILAGVLATINWRLAFLIYAFGVVSMVLVLIKVPEPKKVKEENVENSVNRRMIMICSGILIYAIIYFTFFGYLAFIIDRNGLGDAASSGIATMLMTLFSIFMGIIFGKLVLTIERFILPLSLLANAIGFLVLSMASSIVLIFIGAIFIGTGFGILMPFGTMKVTDAAPKKAATFANGLFMTFVNIGTAISPTITVLLGKVFQNEDGQFIFMLCAIALGLATTFAFAKSLLVQKSKQVA